MNRLPVVCLSAFLLALAWAPLALVADEDQSINPPAAIMNKPSPVLSPEEALKTFQIEEGFEIQLVAAEPMVEDPVCMAWDDRGRLWVCEMTTYMPDQFANGEEAPKGNIVILEDLNGDGVFDEENDRRTVFLDKIVLPRAVAFAGGGVLYADFEKLYYVPMKPDGSAGDAVVVDPAYTNDGNAKSNVEHQANGLLYGLDNYYYSAKSSRRYRLDQGKLRREPTESRGQWGISQDDAGRLLTNDNTRPVFYELLPPNTSKRNPNHNFRGPSLKADARVWPAHPTPGVNRGYQSFTVDHNTWKLKVFTAACGPVIYRGAQFPDAYYNNIFVPEPAANLVKRYVVREDEQGKPAVDLAYEGREFLTSTDERSRIVNAYTGPDGALYLVDMYRGLIQHKTYITDYLTRQINARQLDAPLGYGRVYRVVHKGSAIDPAPVSIADKPAEALVPLLGHPNAWQRHNAQRLLVERGDVNTVDPLNVLATTSDSPQARIHALWTLEGMGKLTAGTLALAGRTDEPRVRVQVLRLSEGFADTPDARPLVTLMQQYGQGSPGWALDMQLALSAGVLAGVDTPVAYDVLLGVLDRRDKVTVEKDHPDYKAQSAEARLFRTAVISGLRGKEAVMLAKVDGWHIKKQLTDALVQATATGDLSIGSLLALVDTPEFADQQNGFLKTLAAQAVEQDRLAVVDELIGRLDAPKTTDANRLAILQGMTQGSAKRTRPLELDGKPAVFEAWQQAPPDALAELITRLDEVFAYERQVVPAEVQVRIDAGRLLYGAQCASCHRKDGGGIDRSAPPLSPSDWVDASPRMLAALVLNGVEGDITVNGKLYSAPAVQPAMRSFKDAQITDQEIADILTYIRSREFGNNAGPVDVQVVTEMRAKHAGRSQPFSPEALWAIHLADQGELGPAIAKAGWLDHPVRGLVITLIAVTLGLGALLAGTLFGAVMPKP